MVDLEVILGFDFGLKRIGVAVGQTLTCTAQALTILSANSGAPNWGEVQNLIDTWHPTQFVVGLPYNMDGSEQHISYAARHFAKQAAKRFSLPVNLIDERLTTLEAKNLYQQHNKKRLQKADSYAAKIILESWLQDNHR